MNELVKNKEHFLMLEMAKNILYHMDSLDKHMDYYKVFLKEISELSILSDITTYFTLLEDFLDKEYKMANHIDKNEMLLEGANEIFRLHCKRFADSLLIALKESAETDGSNGRMTICTGDLSEMFLTLRLDLSNSLPLFKTLIKKHTSF